MSLLLQLCVLLLPAARDMFHEVRAPLSEALEHAARVTLQQVPLLHGGLRCCSTEFTAKHAATVVADGT